jgi:hypothetical protein
MRFLYEISCFLLDDFLTRLPYEISCFYAVVRFAYEISCFLAVTRFPHFLVRFFAVCCIIFLRDFLLKFHAFCQLRDFLMNDVM